MVTANFSVLGYFIIGTDQYRSITRCISVILYVV